MYKRRWIPYALFNPVLFSPVYFTYMHLIFHVHCLLFMIHLPTLQAGSNESISDNITSLYFITAIRYKLRFSLLYLLFFFYFRSKFSVVGVVNLIFETYSYSQSVNVECVKYVNSCNYRNVGEVIWTQISFFFFFKLLFLTLAT